MQLDFASLPYDATPFGPADFGKLYDSLKRAVARYPDNDAYVAPSMSKRPYHPEGISYTWKQTWDEVQKRIAWYDIATIAVNTNADGLRERRWPTLVPCIVTAVGAP